jgi:hypothetical protein
VARVTQDGSSSHNKNHFARLHQEHSNDDFFIATGAVHSSTTIFTYSLTILRIGASLSQTFRLCSGIRRHDEILWFYERMQMHGRKGAAGLAAMEMGPDLT